MAVGEGKGRVKQDRWKKVEGVCVKERGRCKEHWMEERVDSWAGTEQSVSKVSGRAKSVAEPGQ